MQSLSAEFVSRDSLIVASVPSCGFDSLSKVVSPAHGCLPLCGLPVVDGYVKPAVFAPSVSSAPDPLSVSIKPWCATGIHCNLTLASMLRPVRTAKH